MRKLRALALAALALGSITASTAAFATSVYYPECYLELVWTYDGFQYQWVCY